MKEFDALAAAVQKVALLEGYSDAGREEIDEAVSGLRETFVAFCNVSVIRDAVGTNVIEPVLVAIDEDTRRCGNCGNVDCDDEECDDGVVTFSPKASTWMSAVTTDASRSGLTEDREAVIAANNALDISDADDAEHLIECHAATLPDVVRRWSRAILATQDVLSRRIGDMVETDIIEACERIASTERGGQ